MTWSCVPSGVAAGLLLVGAVMACPLEAIEERVAQADEHLFWVEFWTETDEGEASRELGYAIYDLRKAVALALDETCQQDPISRGKIRLARQRLAACLRQQNISEGSNLASQVRRDR